MFYNAIAFNQDVSGWPTEAATTYSTMFNGATEFLAKYSCVNATNPTPTDLSLCGSASIKADWIVPSPPPSPPPSPFPPPSPPHLRRQPPPPTWERTFGASKEGDDWRISMKTITSDVLRLARLNPVLFGLESVEMEPQNTRV